MNEHKLCEFCTISPIIFELSGVRVTGNWEQMTWNKEKRWCCALLFIQIIAIWLVRGVGGIFPSDIIKSVSSLSGNLLNDLRYLGETSFLNLEYLCFYYYLLARNCTVRREPCHDYSSSGLSHAFRCCKKKWLCYSPAHVGPYWKNYALCLEYPSILSIQDLGHSFSQYGPPGWWITYIYFFTCHVLKNVVRVIEGKIIYKITRREMKIGSS